MEFRILFKYILTALVTVTRCSKVKVAVYEHVVISPDNPERDFTRKEAFGWMSKNLAVFAEKSREASHQGAKIIVFPEYGISGFDHSRDSLVPFLENIPDYREHWNPCETPTQHPNTPVLRNLSCIARDNKIYIVANMGDIKYCSRKTNPSCPPDGRFQFNTNVVFDERGTLVARYHKLNMYDETPLYDPAPSPEYIYFDTPYGRFGTIVCFDIMHYYPTQILINKYGVRNILVTSAWNVFYPFVLSVQMYAGLSKRNNVNVIASNVRSSDYIMAGSGIFGPGVEVDSDVNYNSSTGVLLIAEIETDLPKPMLQQQLTTVHSYIGNVYDKNFTHFGTYEYGMNMSYVVLPGDNGTKTVCQDQVCCVVDYRFQYRHPKELFILSAVDFDLEDPGIIHMQFCAVHRCLTDELNSCGGFVTSAKSTFSDIKIQGYFDRGVVFPFVSTSEFGNHTLNMDMDRYMFDKDKAILESHQFDDPLLAAVVYSSLYQEENIAPVRGTANQIHTISNVWIIILICVAFKL